MGKGSGQTFQKKTYKWPIGTWKGAQHHLSSGKCKSKPQWDITSHLLQWLTSERQEITNGSEDVEKRETLYTVGRNVNWYSHYGKQLEVSQEIKNRTTIQSSNPTSVWDTQRKWNHYLKEIIVLPCPLQQAKVWKQPKLLFTDECG